MSILTVLQTHTYNYIYMYCLPWISKVVKERFVAYSSGIDMRA